jgi:hypothetical protein
MPSTTPRPTHLQGHDLEEQLLRLAARAVELGRERGRRRRRLLGAEPERVGDAREAGAGAGAGELREPLAERAAQRGRLVRERRARSRVAERLARASEEAAQQVLDLLEAVVGGERREEPVADALALLGALPEHVAQQQRVGGRDGRAPARVGGDLEEGDGLDEAAVGDVDGRLAALLEVRAQVGDEIQDRRRDGDERLGRRARRLKVVRRQQRRGGGAAGGAGSGAASAGAVAAGGAARARGGAAGR